MVRKALYMVMIFAMAFGMLAFPIAAKAQAISAAWVVSVTYQNVGQNPTTVNVEFYPEGNSTPIVFNPLEGVGDGTLQAGAGASFFIGNVNDLSSGFRGNAIMQSSEPLIATVVQFSQQSGFKMRMLSNGFQQSDASEQYLIATALKNKFSRTSIFSIQNTTSSPVDATVRFYDADAGGNLASEITHSIPAFSSKFIEMNDSSDTGIAAAQFNGSAIVNVPSGSGGVVSAANELYTNRNVGANFEGIPLNRASNTAYMATALCERFGLDTFYAVQNASLTDDASITVTYRDTNGNQKAVDGPYDIGPGQKQSIRSCDPSDGTDMSDYTGSAVIESAGAPIAVIGKAQCSEAAGGCSNANYVDVFTAFLGESAGTSKLGMPFVRWASDSRYFASNNNGGLQRSFIAVQNLENAEIKVNVTYYDKNGDDIATEVLTIPAFSKGNSNPLTAGALGQNGMNMGEFGYYTDGSFGGAAIAEAHPDNPDAQFVSIVRVQNPGAGEDYNAMAIQ